MTAADTRLPVHARGQRIGLLGGSFNPPHEGHRLISMIALHRLRLDWIWWLVTPGNPLKDNSRLPPLNGRIAACRAMAHHPRIRVSGVEALYGTSYTAQTLRELQKRLPGLRLVWLMGADNLAGFQNWQNWRRIAATVPIAVIDRPGSTLRALRARAPTALARFRRPEAAAAHLASADPPAWIFLHGRRSTLSSTALRAGIRWKT
jgi:nicotinate-nucleotide adenylyltransferase